MRVTLLGLLLLALSGMATLEAASPPASGPAHDLLDSAYEIPDHSAEAAGLLKRFLALRAEHEKRLANQQGEGLDDALEGLFLPEGARDFASRYSAELAIAQNPENYAAWRTFALKARDRGQWKEARAAASLIHQRSQKPGLRAEMLAFMAELAAEQAAPKDAINLLAASLAIEPHKDRRLRLDRFLELFDIRLDDIEVNVERRLPSACFVFSQSLKNPQPIEPRDYVSVEPAIDMDVSLAGRKLCVTGVEHGGRYEMAVKKGLVADNGGRTYKDYSRTVEVPDRTARLSFAGNAYVLAKSDARTLPVKTINADAVELALFRVDDRNLTALLDQGFLQSDLSEWQRRKLADNLGAQVWSGTLQTGNVRNQEVTTLVPLGEIITAQEPGIYALAGRVKSDDEEAYWRARPTQWLLISDIGLTSFEGEDGLTVMARSLETAGPKRYVRLTLISRNNRILGRAQTDSQGMAHFAPGLMRGEGGDAPLLVTARAGEGDYNVLRLSGPELVLDERGVAGRAVPAKADAYLYTERGVYRPGETVHLSVLLRDRSARAMGEVPLTLKITRPTGTLLKTMLMTGDTLGGYLYKIPLSPAALAGGWWVEAFLDPEGEPVGQASFQVEDFVPQRVALSVETGKDTLTVDEPVALTAQGTFFYGPPAAGLMTSGGIDFATDPAPFTGYEAYRFGLVDQPFEGDYHELAEQLTDQNGQRVEQIGNIDWPRTSHPLLARISVSIADVSSRPVTAVLGRKVRARAVEIGVKPHVEGGFAENDEAGFDLVALDQSGAPVADRPVRYSLVREHYSYNWYGSGGSWRVRSTSYDEAVEGGTVRLGGDGTGTLARRLEPGRYRLTVSDDAGTSQASIRFQVGWRWAPTPPDVPDALELVVEQDDLKSGDVVKAFIKAPFAGKALVAVAREGVLYTETIDLPEDGAEIEIKTQKDWGPGAYLMVTAFRPDLSTPSLLPSRAMGLRWFSLDKAMRAVTLELDVPGIARPKSTITVPLKISDPALVGQPLNVTLAAVDEGILQLTQFETPDAIGHYLAQRRLGLGIRDLYGYLIPPAEGSVGALQTGGDRARMALDEIMVSAQKRQDVLPERSTKAVALFLNTAQIGADGTGSVELELPDFVGRLRLMAVGYGETRLGGGEADLIVRDDVATALLLPRFLAPDDVATVPLTIHNLTGKDQTFTVTLVADGAVKRKDEAPLEIALKKDERREIPVTLIGTGVGVGRFALTVTGEDSETVTRDFAISVRPAQAALSTRTIDVLEPGASKTLSADLLLPFYPGRAELDVTLAARPDFDVAALLRALDRYPYGCTEQTISTAMPLLYFGALARSAGIDGDETQTRRKIDQAISRVLNRQTDGGGFGLWSAWHEGSPWLNAYVYDFLTRAQAQGFDVPPAAYAHAEHRLERQITKDGSDHPEAQAYALYALARTGVVPASTVRYFAQTEAERMRSRLAFAHLGAALASVGERERAEALFEEGLRTSRPKSVSIDDYGSDLRDSAAALALLAEAFPGSALAQKLGGVVEERFGQTRYFNTQEQVWLALAMHALSGSEGAALSVVINDDARTEVNKPVRLNRSAANFKEPLAITNKGEGPIRLITTTTGHPVEPEKAVSNGYSITRTYYTLDGKRADPARVKQNDRLVVIIEVRSHTGLSVQNVMVADRLPAGFEIENPAFEGGDGMRWFDFLPDMSAPQFSAARDDRYIAAFTLDGRTDQILTAYTVRAVTPGKFVHPGVFVEDMYRPHYHARGPVGAVSVEK